MTERIVREAPRRPAGLVFGQRLLYLLLLYSGLACQFVWCDSFTPALLLGVVAALSFADQAILLAAASILLAEALLGPPLNFFWTAFYNESNYLNILNAEHPREGLTSFLSAVLGVLACYGIGRWLQESEDAAARRRSYQTWLCRGIALLLTLNFVPRALSISPTLVSAVDQEPVSRTYAFDGIVHLKALHLYRQGHDYLDSFWLASVLDRRNSAEFTDEVLKLPRQELYANHTNFHAPYPALFVLWSKLPRPSDVVIVFWILSTILLALTYLTLEVRAGPLAGVLCASLAGALLLYPATNYWLFLFDAWAGLAVLGACLCWVLEAERTAALILVVASLIRLVCIPILGAGFLASLWCGRTKRGVVTWLSALSVTFIAYFVHYQWSQSYGFLAAKHLDSRLHGFTLSGLEATRFGTIFWAGRDLVSYALLSLTWLGGFYSSRAAARFCTCAAAVMVFCVSLLGLGDSSQFYGLNFVCILAVGGSLWAPGRPEKEVEDQISRAPVLS